VEINFIRGEKSIMLPPGKYIIGDPCYTVPDEEWDHVLDESDCFDGQCWAKFKTEIGHDCYVVAFSTAWGDGSYQDEEGRNYGVDAGLIGIIPFGNGISNMMGTNLVEFTGPVFCYYKNGKIIFGNVKIDTDADSEDNNYDDDEEDY